MRLSITGNPESWAQSATITGTVSDQGGSGVQKVVYSTDSTYVESGCKYSSRILFVW